MSARIVTVADAGVEAAARAAADALGAGGLAIVPTDTVYGLCCAAARPDALARIFALKGRGAGKAVALVVADWRDVRVYADLEPWHERVFDELLPGGLTFVVAARPDAPSHLVSPEGTFGFRVPGDEVARAVARALGGPFLATSANRSGAAAPASFEEIDPSLLEAVDVALDAGRCRLGVASTVVDLRGGVRVTRPGAVAEEVVRAAARRARATGL